MTISVIVVDDDLDTVEVFSQYLEMKGIQVVGKGYNGLEAFELYKELRPDVAILDMKMPEYDGQYAIKMIKKEDPKARIMVVTGYSDYNLKDLEVDAIFYKPYNVDQVVDSLRKISTIQIK